MSESDLVQVALRAVRLYAESHLRPSQVSLKQAGEMLGISLPTVRKLVRAGVIRLNKCGLVPIQQIDLALAARAS